MTSLTEKRGRLLQALMMTYQPTVTIKFNKQRENQKKNKTNWTFKQTVQQVQQQMMMMIGPEKKCRANR